MVHLWSAKGELLASATCLAAWNVSGTGAGQNVDRLWGLIDAQQDMDAFKKAATCVPCRQKKFKLPRRRRGSSIVLCE